MSTVQYLTVNGKILGKLSRWLVRPPLETWPQPSHI